MNHIWDEGPVDVKALHRCIGPARGITLNTVQSTMERLYRKGLLVREKVGHAYVYTPCLSRGELAGRMMRAIVDTLPGSEAESVLAAFVSMVEGADDKQLVRLERMIAARRGRGQATG